MGGGCQRRAWVLQQWRREARGVFAKSDKQHLVEVKEVKDKHREVPSGKVTPLMKQYFKVKAKYPDAILLFRVGDFYETFGEDAVKASKALGIVLTNRNNGGSQIELAGFPYHALDMYLPRLVKAGYRVAICEQLEKPSPQKKLVRRGVTEIVTPGVASDDKLLEHNRNNYLAAVHFGKKGQVGLAFLDISTGEFLVSEGNQGHADKLLQSFAPAEVLFARPGEKQFVEAFGDKFYTYKLDDWVFTCDYGREKLLAHFGVSSLKGYGIEGLELAQAAAGAILHYLEATENDRLAHITSVARIQPERYVWLDRFTIRNLELLQSQHEGGTALIDVLDKTCSPMGGRLMRKWVVLPLRSIKHIDARLEMVATLVEQPDLVQQLDTSLRIVGDLERLISKVSLRKIGPREVVQLGRALRALEPLKEALAASGNAHLQRIGEGLDPCEGLQSLVADRLVEDPPANLAKGGVIASGFHAELDELRHLVTHSKDILVEIQQREARRTGIENLKIGFNNVFGYYLEVTNKYKDKGLVPDDWVRKQTLTHSERYITDELKQLETKILGAEERILELEHQLYDQLVTDMLEYIEPVKHDAALLAMLDCLAAFAKIAVQYGYCRPVVDDSLGIHIEQGRHPVIERCLPAGEQYVPNDLQLDADQQQILMITGPNMSGKSALLRQTALICLMAQMGCFVPAAAARVGLLDKVFTRVGATDNLSSGESTFMVEMNETASIMNNLSDRSLILLDEIGRGTSTYDGISIAWAIAEYLHDNGRCRPKTLFATHYHELNELAEQYERIHNYHIATKEVGQKVLFLRKLKPGGSAHSFGIHVARMAGMPREIVARAEEILQLLEKKLGRQEESQTTQTERRIPGVRRPRTNQIERPQALQLSIFDQPDPLWEKVKKHLLELDLNTMTPIEAMMRLHALRKMLEE